MRVFLGITGASGAPYAVRLAEALGQAGCEVGICISRAGIEVLATELYRNPRLSSDETVARFLEQSGGVATIYHEQDWSAQYASGSAKVDGYVICPCSMGTLGTLASGAMSNLIHRAASVALKEGRKLVLCPRETPLSSIHLENMLRLRQAGATILFLAPGFYHGAARSDAPAEPARPLSGVASERLSIDDLVDFIVARCLDQLGIEQTLAPRWGQPEEAGGRVTAQSGVLAPSAVRDMFDRIAPVYDAMNRTMTAGLDRRWRNLAARSVVRPADRVVDVCCGTGDLALADARAGGFVTGVDFSERMLERARRKSRTVDWVRADALDLPFEDGAFDAATVGFGVRNIPELEAALAELRRVLRPGGRLAILEITTPRGALAPFYRLWFDRVVPLLGRMLEGGAAYAYLPASVRRFPGPDALAELMRAHGFGDVRYRLLAAGIVALHLADAR